jgi:hypothetical protein
MALPTLILQGRNGRPFPGSCFLETPDPGIPIAVLPRALGQLPEHCGCAESKRHRRKCSRTRSSIPLRANVVTHTTADVHVAGTAQTDPQTGHSPHRAWVGCLSVDGAGGGAALVCSPRVYILLFISGTS